MKKKLKIIPFNSKDLLKSVKDYADHLVGKKKLKMKITTVKVKKEKPVNIGMNFNPSVDSREKIVNILEEVRRRFLCAYLPGTRCDCKFGANEVGSRGETGNGCPEFRVIEEIFKKMTDEEFKRILTRKYK